MPQMKPMNWMMIFIMINLILMFININIFFNKNNNNDNIKYYNSYKKMNWKW
uniref:ATP synthase complex subunit 8 n=1 Tax=Rhopalomyia pomum TaxID=608481 RepID=C7FIK7_RHOPM|nr:ATP synthase F0 subunit 8 [Rhopalomyia pomum]